MPAASFRDVPVPDRRQLSFLQPAQIRGGVGVIPEHVGAKVWRSAGPLPGSDDREEIAARLKPATDTREQRPLVRERDMDQGVKGHYGSCGCWPQVQRGHVGLHKAGGRDQALSPAKLDSGEINTEHLQPVAGQLAGGRYPRPAAEVNNPGTGPQQPGQFRHPAAVAADILGRGGRRIAIITAVSQRDRIITATDKGTLPRPLSHAIRFHYGYLPPAPWAITNVNCDALI
jgi:hypothetical protein